MNNPRRRFDNEEADNPNRIIQFFRLVNRTTQAWFPSCWTEIGSGDHVLVIEMTQVSRCIMRIRQWHVKSVGPGPVAVLHSERELLCRVDDLTQLIVDDMNQARGIKPC